ncbi:MAG: hypothetical protein CL846_10485 [Crocinitomicaceae bacterium]|nr:hypothetical protein [Crocinitomicaceae bacterium]
MFVGQIKNIKIMQFFYKNILFCISVFIPFILIGQQNNYGYKSLIVPPFLDSISIDSLSINLTTVSLTKKNGETVSKLYYNINPINSKIYFKEKQTDSIVIKYQLLGFNFNKNYFFHDLSLMNHEKKDNYIPVKITSNIKQNDIFNETSLNKTGSLSRGIMVGNNQNFSLNSNLNLQLSGNLSPDLKILASVTDANIPIQPQGNTQQLQDFDQVFIKVLHKNWNLIMGDFWLKKPFGYFLNYNKRGQGIQLENALINKNGSNISFKNSIAISKGKFARNVIQGIEGNQGPYRLNGSENESFIIILSGTENVYIDGKLLKRGQNNDYTIDYNTSELIFTANQLITKDKRIIVEFQYSDKNYARSLLESSSIFSKENLKIFFNFYGEQDSKNQPLQQDFNLLDRDVMENIGDQINQAITSGVDSMAYYDGVNMYEKLDSSGYEIYRFSTDPNKANYRIVFSPILDESGDYIIKEYNAFGKVFEWVSPDTIQGNIIHNGTHGPIRQLVTPKKRQLINAGIEKKWKNNTINFEIASSNMDVNTFSNIDQNDNIGFSGFTKLNSKYNLGKKWIINQNLSLEAVNRNFNRIERFRVVEFERNWNIQQLDLNKNQVIGKAEWKLSNPEKGTLSYDFNSFNLKETYNGLKNNIKLNWTKNINAKIDGSYLTSNGENNSNFLRHESDIYKKIGGFNIGFKDIHEKNKFYNNDTLNNSSYRFYDWKIFIETADSSKNIFQIYYQERYDWFKNESLLKKATSAKSPGLKINLHQNQNNKLTYNLALRNLEITDTNLTNIQGENSLTSRITYQLRFLNGGIYSSSFMEIGSGLELQKEFIYFEVSAGQGIYTWIDYNGNDIKEINEFEIAQYTDQATYIRIFTPNSNYIKVYNYQFSQNLNIDPQRFLDKNKVMGKVFRKFYNQTALNTNKKTNEFNFEKLINPLTSPNDTSIQNLSNSFRNSFFFNRSSPVYSFEYTTQIFGNKQLLMNGSDYKTKYSNQLKIRWNITKEIMVNLNLNQELKSNFSSYALTRNYELNIDDINGKFSFQPNTLFRISLVGRYAEKTNSLDYGGEKAFLHDFGIDFRKSKKNKGLFSGNIHIVNIKFNGESNSTIGFEMLEALQHGINTTWMLNFQRNLAKNLQLSLNYNGRKSQENNAIHNGGVQLRAFF